LAGDHDLIERDYAKNPLTRAEILRIVKGAGSVAAVLNLRHATAREGGWKLRPPSAAAFAAAASDEPNLLRRPVFLRGDKALVSRDEAEIRAFLA